MFGQVMTAAMIAACQQRVVRPLYLVSIGTASGDFKAWTGWGDLSWSGDVFYGAGDVGGVGSVEVPTDNFAAGLTLSLPLKDEYISMALSDLRTGDAVTVWYGLWGDGVPVDSPVVAYRGFVDVPGIDLGSETNVIKLAVESRMKRLKTATEYRYTDADQQRVYPGDLGFVFVPSVQEIEVRWGK